MKGSLHNKILYSFMIVVVIVLIGLSFGLSAVIRDYFFGVKQRDLVTKGQEIARVAGQYCEGKTSREQLSGFVDSVDSLLDSRVWVVDRSRQMLAMSSRRGHGPGRGRGPGMVGMGPGAMTGGMHTILADLEPVFAGEIRTKTFYNPVYEENMIFVALPMRGEQGAVMGAVVLNAPVKGVDDFLRRLYLYIAAAGFFALLLTVFVVNRITRGIVKPLKEMQAAAADMARGNYYTRIKTESDDEIGELGKSLNALAQDLENFVSQTEKMEKIRRDFVANVSHELRTPLTVIRGYNEALMDGTVTDSAQAARYHRMIQDESCRLERLINELLDLSRLQSGNPLWEKEKIPIKDVADSVVAMLQERARQKGVFLRFEADAAPVVEGSGDRLTQLLVILVDNAVKFTPAGGSVTVRTTLENNFAVLEVADTGQGIRIEDLPFIWERFYKGDKAHIRDNGSGLGLAIARQIIDLHGAQAEVQSSVGKGTTFRVLFPLVA